MLLFLGREIGVAEAAGTRSNSNQGKYRGTQCKGIEWQMHASLETSVDIILF